MNTPTMTGPPAAAAKPVTGIEPAARSARGSDGHLAGEHFAAVVADLNRSATRTPPRSDTPESAAAPRSTSGQHSAAHARRAARAAERVKAEQVKAEPVSPDGTKSIGAPGVADLTAPDTGATQSAAAVVAASTRAGSRSAPTPATQPIEPTGVPSSTMHATTTVAAAAATVTSPADAAPVAGPPGPIKADQSDAAARAVAQVGSVARTTTQAAATSGSTETTPAAEPSVVPPALADALVRSSGPSRTPAGQPGRAGAVPSGSATPAGSVKAAATDASSTTVTAVGPTTPATPAAPALSAVPVAPAAPAVPSAPAAPVEAASTETPTARPVVTISGPVEVNPRDLRHHDLPAVAAPSTPTGAPAVAGTVPTAATEVLGPLASSAPTSPAAQLAQVIAPLHAAPGASHVVTVELHPAELGAVRVVVELRDGAMHVRLSGNEIAVDALRGSLSDLRHQLEQLGTPAASIDVSAGSGRSPDQQPGAATSAQRLDRDPDQRPRSRDPDGPAPPSTQPTPGRPVLDLRM